MKTIRRTVLYAFVALVGLVPLLSCTDNEPAKAATSKTNATETLPVEKEEASATHPKLVYGKYGCTASKYRNGSYEYIPRGFFTLTKNGKYTYEGFEKPSTGSFTVDEKGDLLFIGGYFDGGKAEKTDRPNKYLLVFPANPDNRWTCGLIEK